MSHADQTRGGKFSQEVKENLFTVRKRTRVDSANIARESVDDIMIDLLSFVIFKFDDFGVPSLGLDALDNGDGIFSEAVGAFVSATDGLEDTDSLSFFDFFRCNTGTHSSPIKILISC